MIDDRLSHLPADLPAQIRALFPDDSAAVSADEAIRTASVYPPTGRRIPGDSPLMRRKIGLRPAIAWGVGLVICAVALGIGIGTSTTSGRPRSHPIPVTSHPTSTTRTTSTHRTATPTTYRSTYSSTTVEVATLRPGSSVTSGQLQDISFANDEVGFATVFDSAGGPLEKGALAITRDAGATWVVVGNLPDNLAREGDGSLGFESAQPVFTSPTTGFLWDAGSATIELTDDGGMTWSPFDLPYPPIASAEFGHTVLLIDGGCAHVSRPPSGNSTATGCEISSAWSNDGGQTWTQTKILGPFSQSTWPSVFQGVAVTLASTTNAFLIADGQTYENTGDRAAWQRISAEPCPPESEQFGTQITASEYPVQAIYIACAGEPSAGNQAKAVYSSTDGLIWTLQAAAWWGPNGSTVGSFGLPPSQSGGYVGQMHAVSATTVYMVLARLGLIVSTDGGHDWSLTSMGAADGAGGGGNVDFVDPAHGWVNFEGEGLWGTTNGSRWTPRDGTTPAG
jgi:hypothetical protein